MKTLEQIIRTTIVDASLLGIEGFFFASNGSGNAGDETLRKQSDLYQTTIDKIAAYIREGSIIV